MIAHQKTQNVHGELLNACPSAFLPCQEQLNEHGVVKTRSSMIALNLGTQLFLLLQINKHSLELEVEL